ncbi:OLC1v1016239C1 [Oldenlandia corymbosa var. corymbosa]|uniref:OLC1v1016239C1 n=1 Tax=Oldenlandia corymbosa var. corymbosa TaxID=529605 RepID=A0AAV1E6N0_OLDCO|nr:OLC1v1016239C1 [Oldenlandia corymbosa var. corymbosa]
MGQTENIKSNDGLYIDENVLSNIFSRLDIESTGRFRCACKTWEELLKLPDLVTRKRDMYYNESIEHLLTFTQRNIEIDGDGIKPVLVVERRMIIMHTTTTEVQSNKNLTIRPERRNEEDDMHKIMPITTDLIDQVSWKAVDMVCPFRVDEEIWMDRYVYWPIDKPRSRMGPQSMKLLVSFDTETETFQWKPGFKFEEDPPIVPIWVSLHDLPIEFLNPKVIFSMAMAIGKPLKVDTPTLNLTRPSVARLCVEVELKKDFPKSVKVGRKGKKHEQFFTYEHVPAYCSKCSKIGHKAEDFKKGIARKLVDDSKQKNPAQDVPPKSILKKLGNPSAVLNVSNVAQTKGSSSGLTRKEKVVIPVEMQGSPRKIMTESKPVSQAESETTVVGFAARTEAKVDNVATAVANRFEALELITETDTEGLSSDVHRSSLKLRRCKRLRLSSPQLGLKKSVAGATRIDNAIQETLMMLGSDTRLPMGHFVDDCTVGMRTEDMMFADIDQDSWSEGEAKERDVLELEPAQGVVKAKKRGQPMLEKPKVDEMRWELGFDLALSSETSKIWVFWKKDFSVSLIDGNEQVLHFEATHGLVLGGDFNVIRSLEEYSGQSVQDHVAITEFNECIETCSLFEKLPICEEYTWGGTRSTGWISDGTMITDVAGIENDAVQVYRELLRDSALNQDVVEAQNALLLHSPSALSNDDCDDLLKPFGLVANYRIPRGSFVVSHLAFADDLIIFTKGLKKSLRELNSFLATYEQASGQKFQEEEDLLFWQHNPNGSFTVKSAYDDEKATSGGRLDMENLVKAVPLRTSFFVWKLRNKLLPFPEILCQMGIQILPSVCLFCYENGEGFEHTVFWLSHGMRGLEVLCCFVASQDERYGHSCFNFTKIVEKREQEFGARNVVYVAAAYDLVGLMIKVHDLKVRNSEEKDFFKSFFGVELNEVSQPHAMEVKWTPPISDSYILNSDGSSVLSEAGYGYVIHGEGGVFIHGESGYLGGGDSYMAEMVKNWTMKRFVEWKSKTNEMGSEKPKAKFYKIIDRPVSEGIRIPSAFMHKHGHKLGKVVTLKDCWDSKWKVTLRHTDTGTKLMGQDLIKFEQERGIAINYILVFTMKDNAKLRVGIFDDTATKVDYSGKCNGRGQDKDKEPRSQEEDTVFPWFEFTVKKSILSYPFQLAERNDLWEELIRLNGSINNEWLAMGDYNNVLGVDERMGGNQLTLNELLGLQRCVKICELQDLKQQSLKFTWSNKQLGEGRICSRIDRALVNGNCVMKYQRSKVTVLAEGISDHSPLLVQMEEEVLRKPKSFKYFNMWSQSRDFLKVVKASWSEPVMGTCMYQLVKKLKRLKSVLKQLNRNQFPDIHQQMQQSRASLQLIQERVSQNPTDENLQKLEREEYKSHLAVSKAYESFVYQKAKEFWIKQGDSNSTFFHAKMRIRTMKNRILSFVNDEGVLVSDWKLVAEHFVGFYQAQLGQTSARVVADPDIFNLGPTLDWKK